MQSEDLVAIFNTLSQERIEGFRTSPTDMPHDLLSRYFWNVALSESLYPGLHAIEVALRNSINKAASPRWGITWFDSSFMHQPEITRVIEVKTALKQRNKAFNANRIIAELSFGFWVSLLDKRYEQKLWPMLLKEVFPYMPRTLRTRHNVLKRFEDIRHLRNRVFHYEPIWQWKDLAGKHQDILEAVGWISPALQIAVNNLDRFPTIYQGGIKPLPDIP